MSLPKLEEWRAEQVRVTFFTTTPLDDKALDWWKLVTAKEAESTAAKRQLGIFTAEGQIDGGRLLLNIAPGRIDWFLVGQASETDLVPDAGVYSDAEALLFKLLAPWFKETKIDMIRVAYGATVRFAVPDRVSGYRTLVDLLPTVQIDPENSSELIYQINRPTISKVVNGVRLNTISKWGVMHFGIGSFGGPAMTTSSQYCRVELDFSTDAEWKSDLAANSRALLEELVTLARARVTQGDRK